MVGREGGGSREAHTMAAREQRERVCSRIIPLATLAHGGAAHVLTGSSSLHQFSREAPLQTRTQKCAVLSYKSFSIQSD